ncbi:MAG: aspartate aminotransferase family protein [Phycisphaeraceae bacterium]|nr:aspartate aminotransferase family protein [Phycisphaeraceae bacterium]MCW5762711.1 aspartate aminotransferase family protein [Phycisphaeraceae bacterium]
MNSNLLSRRQAAVCPGVGRITPLVIERASGALLIADDGREYIDFASGIGVMNVGHCDATVVTALREQAGRLLHNCFHVATYEPYVALCEELVRLFPHGGSDGTKAMLVNTGAEAVENAIKIARQATGRDAVICFTEAFHGRTLLCSTLTSKVEYKTGCGPFVPEVYRLPYPKRTRASRVMDDAAFSRQEIARLRMALRNTVAAQQVAAIIIELVQGEGGFNVAPKPYVRMLRDLCNEHGIMLIFDEVQTGFGRTGRWAASEHYSVEPDLSTWAKSMGGGLPIAAVVGKASVMDRVAPGTVGGTYGGNPVACAAALATIERMKELNLNARAEHIGRSIRNKLEGLAKEFQVITDVRGLGAMIAVEFNDPPETPAPALVKAIIDSALAQGVLLISAGVSGNVIRFLPPLVMTDAQLDRGLAVLESAIRQHAATNKPYAESHAS